MKKIAYEENSLNEIISLLNGLELAPGRNMANAQRLAEVYKILNEKGSIVEEQEDIKEEE